MIQLLGRNQNRKRKRITQ